VCKVTNYIPYHQLFTRLATVKIEIGTFELKIPMLR